MTSIKLVKYYLKPKNTILLKRNYILFEWPLYRHFCVDMTEF